MISTEAETGEGEEEEENAVIHLAYRGPRTKAPRPQEPKNSKFKLQTSIARIGPAVTSPRIQKGGTYKGSENTKSLNIQKVLNIQMGQDIQRACSF